MKLATGFFLLTVLFLTACNSTSLSETPQEIVSGCNTLTKGEKTDPGMACYKSEDSLPTAIQFGDSVSKGYGIAARHDLCGVVDYRHDNWDRGDIDLCGEAYNPYDAGQVIAAGNNNGYSTTLVSAMERRLGGAHFNVVLFNSGYHDIQHHVAQSSYRNNLEAAAQMCEQSADICIWVDTPGLGAPTLDLDGTAIDATAVTEYNDIARSVAQEHGFYMLAMSDKDHAPDGSVHFSYKGYGIAGAAVSDCVLTALAGSSTQDCHK